jgi:hypothetical protein
MLGVVVHIFLVASIIGYVACVVGWVRVFGFAVAVFIIIATIDEIWDAFLVVFILHSSDGMELGIVATVIIVVGTVLSRNIIFVVEIIIIILGILNGSTVAPSKLKVTARRV